MNASELLPLVAGGAGIGAAAALLLLFDGEIAGISGIHARLLAGESGRGRWRLAFLAGLLLPALVLLLRHAAPATGSLGVMAGAGLLVGVGTRLGGGCTSGHGVCGIARLSKRSFVAVGIFFAVAIITVTITGIV